LFKLHHIDISFLPAIVQDVVSGKTLDEIANQMEDEFRKLQ